MINLYLMGKKGFSVLENLLENYSELINMVISSKDQSVEADFYNEIQEVCSKRGIPFYDKSDKFSDDASYSIAISWRWLIQKNVGQLIVLHDSILPKYRGFNPLVSYLLNHEKEIGCTAIFPTENYDEGNIIYQAKREIKYPIKIIEAIDIISESYTEITEKIFEKIKMNILITSKVQDHSLATYSLWRDEKDYIIDWSSGSEYIQRFVNATGYPYKGAYTLVNDRKVRIKTVSLADDVKIENRCPGKIIFLNKGIPTVVCGSGLLKIIDAHYDDTQESLIPHKNFRTRFGSEVL